MDEICPLELVLQQVGQQEVAQMVDTEVNLEAVIGFLASEKFLALVI